MQENIKAQRTREKVDLQTTPPYYTRCRQIPFSVIVKISYRCLVAVGAVTVIFILINLQRNQFQLEDIIFKATTNLRSPREEYNEYVVYNPSCEIPDYPAFHKDVKPYFWKMPATECPSEPLLTSVTHFSDSNFTYVLNLNKSEEAQYFYNRSKLECCFSIINTVNLDYKMRDCQLFDTNVILDATADLVHINCKDGNHTVYKLDHFLVPIKDAVRQKMELADKNYKEQPMSVMIVGLGSVSRLNLIRTMPATVGYLENNGWFTFPAYHRIQQNKLYNIIGPLLTGHQGYQLRHTCWPDDSNNSDSCPFIWKNYSARNYITAYGEDAPTTDYFQQFGSEGFSKQPTDYFLTPQMNLTEITIGTLNHKNGITPKCIGPMNRADYILDFAADFASTFAQYPTFSLFWLNTHHNDLNAPQILNQRFVEYFGKLNSSGALNRTMVVFMSDHGFQPSHYRATHMGFMEESMPFLYIWLPNWFRDKYPDKIDHMERNKHRLATHFDLYLTLMDVLGVKAKAVGCPTCVSLFEPVPWNRGCADAGIAIQSCACDHYGKIVIDSNVKKIVEQVVRQINNEAASYKKYVQKGFKCSNVTIKHIESARRDVLKNQDFGRKYVINLVTAPKHIMWEAFVLSHPQEVVSIEEYTPHGTRSHCMNNRHGKKWCVCEHLNS